MADSDRSTARADEAPSRRAERHRRRLQARKARRYSIIPAAGTAIALVGVLLGGVGQGGSVNGAAGRSISPAATEGELVVNGTFEQGLHGWRSNDAKLQPLATGAGRESRTAAVLRGKKAGTLVLNDARNTVQATTRSDVYDVSAWVRTDGAAVTGRLRLRETRQGKLLLSSGKDVRITKSWTKVSYRYVPVSAGSVLDLNVVAWKVPAGTSVFVDDVSMRQVGTNPVPAIAVGPVAPLPPAATYAPEPGQTPVADPAPTQTASPGGTTQPAPPTSGGGCAVSARGIPGCGAFFGAAVGSNTDPAAKEAQFGGRFGVRRTYWSGTQVDSAVRVAKEDLAAGRLPWISFKLPHSWTEMANGSGDAWARDLTAKLDALNGPVWVAFHHEPEGDGDITEWTRMQRRLSPIVRSADNVAFTIVLTGWHQFYGNNPAYRLDALWPGRNLVDVLGVDLYNEYGVTKNGAKITKDFDFKTLYYDKLKAWSATNGVRWALGEAGYTHEAAAKDPTWLARSFRDLVATGGVAFAYFDTWLNAYGSWPLETPEKIQDFSTALRSTARIR